MNARQKIRVDKWLWAARFFKSRTLASDAVNGGKIHVNGQRARPSRPVQIGDRLEITRGQHRATIVIRALDEKRGSAKVAQTLYEETQASTAQRELDIQQRRLLNAGMPQSKGRPDKLQRRQLRKASGKL